MEDWIIILLENLHYYILAFIGFLIWSANYITSPKHESLLSNNIKKDSNLVKGLYSLLFFLLIIIIIMFIMKPTIMGILLFYFVFMMLIYLLSLTILKDIFNPLIYHDIYLKSNKKKYLNIRIIKDKNNKYLIWTGDEFLFVKKDEIKSIKFNENSK